MEQVDETIFEVGSISGESHGLRLERTYSRFANSKVRGAGDNEVVDLGPDIGEVRAKDIRFRDAVEQGMLRAYIRQEATDPKVIVPTIVALGLVAMGIRHIKHRQK